VPIFSHNCLSLRGTGQKQTLNPEDVSYTGRYDGSDSSEEYAFKLMSQIILMNKSLELFPLPDNFSKKLELFNINQK